MQEPRLTPIAFIVLCFVDWAGQTTPYRLKQMVAASVGNFWTLQHAQLYTEPERLAQAGYLTEQRDLAPIFAEQLAAAVNGTSWRPPQPGERKVDWPKHFSRVGNVDALVARRHEPARRVFIELKCDYSPKGLHACAYDLVKCAVGLALGDASASYLVAANIKARWDEQVLGVELFDGGSWTAEKIRETYASAFRGYEKLADPRPEVIPSTMTTCAVGAPARVDVAGVPWEIRVCRVEAEPACWFGWRPFLTPEQTAFAVLRRAQRR